jgi:hypothetical protein
MQRTEGPTKKYRRSDQEVKRHVKDRRSDQEVKRHVKDRRSDQEVKRHTKGRHTKVNKRVCLQIT